LEQAIRKANGYTGNASGIIYTTDVLGITELVADRAHIISIEGIQFLTNLTTLYFYENSVSDISALVDNNDIGENDSIRISDNELNLTDGSDDMQNIQTLKNRGATISY
jgi:Leucine-rich repeat (LRR) protein